MEILSKIYSVIMYIFTGALFKIPLPGGSSIDISLMILLLVPAGIYFMIRTKFVTIRMFPEMLRISVEKNDKSKEKGTLSGIQALIVSTATRVGMGNLIGVVAAITLGGAGAIFWMWIMAIIGSSPRLSRRLSRRNIRSLILFTAVSVAVPRITYTRFSQRARKRVLWLSSLRFRDYSAGAR